MVFLGAGLKMFAIQIQIKDTVYGSVSLKGKTIHGTMPTMGINKITSIIIDLSPTKERHSN